MEVEGPKSPEEMLVILQRVIEESSPVLLQARLDAEERRNNMRLREEQDAAYRAALEADQVGSLVLVITHLVQDGRIYSLYSYLFLLIMSG